MRSNHHKVRAGTATDEEEVVVLQCAFKSRIMTYRVSSKNSHVNVKDFMGESKDKVVALIENQIRTHKAVKLNFELFGYFILEAKEIGDIKSFNSRNEIATVSTNLDDLYEAFVEILDAKVFEFLERDSGMCIATPC